MKKSTCFKPGDRVIARSDLIAGNIYGGIAYNVYMSYLDRGPYTIDKVSSQGSYSVRENPFYWSREMLQPYRPPEIEQYKIVVTNDGRDTTARLYKGKSMLDVATARCHPDDPFDLSVGAQLAVERLLAGGVEPQTIDVSRYSGKIVCVQSCIDSFKKGKVYNVRFGELLTEAGDVVQIPAMSFSGVAYYLAHHKYDGASFIELIED